jgi:uncharacterized membrane protein
MRQGLKAGAVLLAAAVGLAGLGTLGAAAQTQDDEDRERCYGVAPAGENDGIGEREDPGSSSVDYQGDAWAWVPANTCLTRPLPPQPDGTPRRGSFEPLARDRG